MCLGLAPWNHDIRHILRRHLDIYSPGYRETIISIADAVAGVVYNQKMRLVRAVVFKGEVRKAPI
jgi:hypothetical protein